MSRRKPAATSRSIEPQARGRIEASTRPPKARPIPAEVRPPAWPNRAMEGVWLAVAAATPAIANPFSVRIFEAEKVAFLRSAALVLVALWIVESLTRTSPPRRQDTKTREEMGLVSWCLGGLSRLLGGTSLAYPVVALMAAYLVAALLSEVPRVSLLGSYRRQFGALTFLSYGVIFFAVATHLRTPAQARRLLVAIALGTLLPALAGVLQMSQQLGLPAVPGLVGWLGGAVARASGTLGNATYLGGYLAVALPATLYLLLRGRSTPVRATFGTLIALQLVALAVTEARAAWLGAGAGVAILALLSESTRRKSRLLRSRPLQAALAAALLVLVVANVPGTGLHEAATRIPYLGRLARLGEFESGSGRVRALIWAQVPSVVAERPLFGHGPDTISYAFERYYPSELFHLEMSTSMVDRTHNGLLEVLTSAGLAGAAAQLALLAALLATYWRVRRGDAATGGRGDGETRGRGDAGTRRRGDSARSTQDPGLRTQDSAPSTQHPALSTHHVALAGLGAGLVDQMAGIPSAIPTLLFWLYLGFASASARMALLSSFTPDTGAPPPRPQDTRRRSQGILVSWGLDGYRLPVVLALAMATAAGVWAAAAPVSADVQAARGAVLLAASRWRESVDAYQAAIGINPESEYFLQMSQVAVKAAEQPRQPDAASWLKLGEETLLGAQRADPMRADIALAQGRLHRSAANLLADQAQKEKALEAFQRAVSLAPRRALALDSYAGALMALGRYEEALAWLQRSAELDPAYAPTYGYLGDTYFALGRHEEALDAFRRAVELDPNSSALRMGMARAHVRRGDLGQAVAEYQRALELAPRNAGPYLELADLHQRAGDPVKARQVLSKGLEVIPGHPDLTAALGRLPRP